MGAPAVLTEKLRRPEAAGLRRARLERPLLHLGSRLGLVVAPPGSGKTTLLAGVASAAETPVAWYRVTADDADEGSLVAHLRRAMQDALGIPARAAVDGAPDTQDGMSDLLETLEGWSAGAPAPSLVILDDLHEIAGSAAEEAVERFVALRPHAIGVLIGSRRHPGMNIPRLRVSGELFEITSDDLRFRSWEVEELFIGVFNEPLSPESAAALTRRTGGWAAGLQLFHLATAGRSVAERQRAVDDLGGRSKLVRSYLARNVLNDLPESRRQFLLRTCTLGSMTGPLCDALLETTGSAIVLDEFEQQQMFTSSEDDGATFRYHEVLRTHLEWALIQEYGPEGARSWYARSAGLLEQIGDRRGAVRAYARAEDWGAVARLIQAGSVGPVGVDAGADVLLPASVVQSDPWLSLAQARRRVREGSLVSAVEAFRQAEELLDEPEFRESCHLEREVAQLWAGPAAALGWAPAPAAPIRHWSARLRGALRRAPAEPVGDPSSRAFREASPGERLGTGIAALITGDVRGARRILDRVEADDRADAAIRLLAQIAGTVTDLISDGEDPSGPLSQIALDAELAGLPWIARLARGLEDAVLVGAGAPPWRLGACIERLRECERSGDHWGAAILALAAAVACEAAAAPAAGGGPIPVQGAGVAAEPGPTFADAALRFRRLDASVLAVWCDALDACLRPRGPDAGARAARVISAARSAQVPAVEAIGRAAVGVLRAPDSPDGSAFSELGSTLGMFALTGLLRRAAAAAHVAPPVGGGVDSADHATPAPAAGPPAVRIRCFSGFAIEVDGRPIDLSPLRPRARSLLRLLAVGAGRDVHRETLVDALWPGVDVAVGTRRLQVAVSSARHLLESSGLPGADMIGRHGDAYRLALPPGGAVDVLEFDAAVRDAARAAARGDRAEAIASRETALAAYTGDLLPEEGPAEQFSAERDRYRLAAAEVAARLAEDHHVDGAPAAALAAARRSVHLDRYQDAAWRTLIEVQLAAGDATAAERTRRDHARAQAELDIVAP